MKILNIGEVTSIRETFKGFKSEIQYIAFVYTSWHLDNLLVYLKYNKLSLGLIFILPQVNIKDESRFRLNEQNFTNPLLNETKIVKVMDTNYKFLLFSFLNNTVFKNDKSNLLRIINPGGVNVKLLTNINLNLRYARYVIIDEGLGTYMSPKLFQRVIVTENKRNYYWIDFKKNITEIIKEKLIKFSKIKIEKFTLYEQRDKLLITNKIVSTGLKELYKKDETTVSSAANNLILFFKDFGVLPPKSLAKFHNDLFRHLSKKNINILIKKHPNDKDKSFDDSVSKYNKVTIIQDNSSGERIVARYKPVCIVGGFSTAVFASASISGIKTYCFMDIYKNNKDLSIGHHELIASFKEKFNGSINNLIFIDTIEQIL